MKFSRQIAGLVAVALLAGCSGGSGSPVAPTPAKAQQTPAAGMSTAGKARVAVRFTIGKSRAGLRSVRSAKSREYVSPGTEGAVVTAVSVSSPSPNPANDATYGYDLTDPGASPAPSPSPAASPVASTTTCVDNASGGGRICTLVFPLDPDTYDITVTTYDTAQTNATATTPSGKPLSTQTLTNQTVSASASNAFTFALGAYVEGFDAPGSTSDTHFGTAGGAVGATGSGTQSKSVTVAALDPAGYQIDQYAGDYPYANPATVSIAAAADADASGCSGASPCVTVQPGAETTLRSEAAGSATSTIAMNADETLHYTYNGGGGVGSYIESATDANAAPPAGSQRPYYVPVSLTPAAAAGVSVAGFTSYFVPLFAYAATTSASAPGTLLVWAAQASPPGGASYATGSGYSAQFPADSALAGSTTNNCYDANNDVVMSVDTGVYHQLYGEAYVVTLGSFAGSCTLMLSDGATTPSGTPDPDVVSLTLTNTSPGVVFVKPSPKASPLAPTGPAPTPTPTASPVI